jgi:hypothetical protein
MKNIKNALSLNAGKNLATVTPQSFGVKIRGTLVFLCPKEKDRDRERARERGRAGESEREREQEKEREQERERERDIL